MKKIHQMRKKIFNDEKGEVILQKDYHNNMQFSIHQEGQHMLKLLKVNNMMMTLKNLIPVHIGGYPTLHMQRIHTR